MSLRPYQEDAVRAIFDQLGQVRATMLVLPTGTGKTVAFAEVARRYIKGTNRCGAARCGPCQGAWPCCGVPSAKRRVLVLAHREELLEQAADKIRSFAALTTELEMGAQRAAGGLFGSDVVLGSVATLAIAARRERFSPDEFGLIIIDEAHHATAATYVDILAYFASAKVLGVTATPDRMDGKGMGAVFNSVAYVYEIRDAIEQGFLVPIRQKVVQLDSLDLTKVRASGADLNEDDLEALLTDEQNLHGVVLPSLELAEQRPTVVFGTSIAHATQLAEVFNRYRPGCARSVDGKMDRTERKGALRDFSAGKFQFLCNNNLLTEGYDAPLISCVAIARPTKSRALYSQMAGRGTRLCPDTGKRDLLVLDFAGNAGKHSLVSALDILDARQMAPEVRARAERISRDNTHATITEVLDRAAEEVAAATRKTVLAKARYQVVELDPFTVLGVDNAAGRWGGLAPTAKQLEMLERNLGKVPGNIDKGQASALIGAVIDRRNRGLCSFKQAKVLAKYGLNPDVSFDRARWAMDQIAAGGWRQVPDEVARHPELLTAGAA